MNRRGTSFWIRQPSQHQEGNFKRSRKVKSNFYSIYRYFCGGNSSSHFFLIWTLTCMFHEDWWWFWYYFSRPLLWTWQFIKMLDVIRRAMGPTYLPNRWVIAYWSMNNTCDRNSYDSYGIGVELLAGSYDTMVTWVSYKQD